MLTIKTYRNNIEEHTLNLVIPIIKKQMEFIGSSKSKEAIKDGLISAFNHHHSAVLFVCYLKDEPIAFAFGNIGIGLENGLYYWLNEIFMEESYRHKGYTSIFLSEIEQWLKNNNINYIASMTSLSNKASQKFFSKNDYALDSVIWIDKSLTSNVSKP